MKKFTILLLMCIFLTCVFPLIGNAADEMFEIDITGYKYSAVVTKGDGSAQLRNGGYLGYDIDLGENKTGAAQLRFRMGTEESGKGSIEIRLGSATGELLGTVDTTKLTNIGWYVYTTVDIYLSRQLSGKQTIFVCNPKGIYTFHDFNLKIIDPSIASVKFASLENIDLFDDIRGDRNKTEINLMAGLGVVSGESRMFFPTRPVSRIEFASMLGKIIQAERYSDGMVSFGDVDIDDENAKILDGLYKLGIVRGDTNGNFRPNDFITLDELATVCTNALGYRFIVDSGVDVQILANKLKLFKGIDTSDKYINRSDSARLLYNLFTADSLVATGADETGIFYKEEENYIEKNTEYIHDIGVVTANYDTQLYAPGNDLNSVVINDMTFEAGNTYVTDCLGVKCEYFYYEEDGKKILAAIYPARNVEIVIHESQSGHSFEVISEKEIIYYDGNDDYEYKLSNTTAIVYNGVALDCPLNTVVDVNTFVGTITLINNNADNIYDCVRIDHAKTMIVDGVSVGRIRDLLSGTVLNCYDDKFCLFVDGQIRDEGALNPGDVLTVYQSANKTGEKLIRILAEQQLVNGEITQINLNPRQLIIDGIAFEIAPECTSNLYIGLKGDFYLNAYGFIVKYEGSAESDVLLGLYMAAGKSDSVFDPKVKLKILTENNGIVVYEIHDSVTADGVRINDVDDFCNGKNAFCGINNVAVNTPILYQIDGENRIIMIDTVEKGAENEKDNLTCLGEQKSWYGSNNTLVDTTWVPRHPYKSTSKTIVLTSDGIEENYYIEAGVRFENDIRISAVPYTIKKNSIIADVLLASGYTASVHRREKPFVYEETMDIINDDGEKCKLICGTRSDSVNERVSYEVADDSYTGDFKVCMDSLKKGDLVQVGLTNFKVTDIDIAFLPDAEAINEAGVNALLNENTRKSSNERGTLYYCEVVAIEDGFIKVDLGNGDYAAFGVGDIVTVCEKTSSGKIYVTNNQKSTGLFVGEKFVAYVQLRKIVSAFVYRDAISE